MHMMGLGIEYTILRTQTRHNISTRKKATRRTWSKLINAQSTVKDWSYTGQGEYHAWSIAMHESRNYTS